MSWIDIILGIKPQTDKEIIREFEEGIEQMISQQETMSLKQGAQESQQYQLGDNVRVIVEFILSKSDDISMNIKWTECDDITAERLGYLIYKIHSGDFTLASKNILIGVAKQQPSLKNFIRKSFESWYKQTTEELLIKPSEVFRMGNQPGPPSS